MLYLEYLFILFSSRIAMGCIVLRNNIYWFMYSMASYKYDSFCFTPCRAMVIFIPHDITIFNSVK